MKTKSFLFASLLTFSFAITSCQKEENILPVTDHTSLDQSKKINPVVITENFQEIEENQIEVPQGSSVVRPSSGQVSKDTIEVLAPINFELTK